MPKSPAVGGLIVRIAVYASAPAINLAISFGTLPILARHVSSGQWSALAVGQSVGMIASLVGGGGWALTGPAAVALGDQGQKQRVYSESVRTRLPLTAAALVIAAVLSWVLLRGQPGLWLGLIGAASTSLTGLSNVWFMVGTGRPSDMLRFEVLPRAILLGGAAGLVFLDAPPELYPASIGLGFVLSFGLFTWSRRHLDSSTATSSTWEVILRQRHAMGTILASGAYTSAGATLVSLGSGVAAVAEFNSCDRLYKSSLLSLASLNNGLQAWALSPQTSTHRRRRVMFGFLLHGALGLVGLLLLVSLGPQAATVLFGADLSFSRSLAVLAGINFMVLNLGTPLVNLVMVPRGLQRQCLRGTIAGALVGVPAIIVGAHMLGATGGMAGVVLSECLTTAWCAWATIRSTREPVHPPPVLQRAGVAQSDTRDSTS